MYGLLVGFGLMFDKGQKQWSTLSCDSSYFDWLLGPHKGQNFEKKNKKKNIQKSSPQKLSSG